MQAVLYVAHGSRINEGVRQAEAFLRKSMIKIDVPIQEHSFLELAEPTIEEGFVKCMEQGATSIAIVPLLLLPAGHAKHDIPREIKRMQERFPNVHICYGQPLGVHDAIVDILVERIMEKQETIANDACILLVGRGSSDPETGQYFREIATLLKQKSGISRVSTCFLAACKPDFETGLEMEVKQGSSQIFVVPYLLFTGVLMKTMEQKIRELKTPNQSFLLCHSLGYHENLVRVLTDRVQEVLIHSIY